MGSAMYGLHHAEEIQRCAGQPPEHERREEADDRPQARRTSERRRADEGAERDHHVDAKEEQHADERGGHGTEPRDPVDLRARPRQHRRKQQCLRDHLRIG